MTRQTCSGTWNDARAKPAEAKKRCPRGHGTDAGKTRSESALLKDRLLSGECQDRFPVCELHRCRLVHGFPEGCPFKRVNPLEAIGELHTRGWTALGAHEPDFGGAGDAFAKADVCSECVTQFLGHPHVRRLREQPKQSAPEPHVQQPQTPTPGPTRRHGGDWRR